MGRGERGDQLPLTHSKEAEPGNALEVLFNGSTMPKSQKK